MTPSTVTPQQQFIGIMEKPVVKRFQPDREKQTIFVLRVYRYRNAQEYEDMINTKYLD